MKGLQLLWLKDYLKALWKSYQTSTFGRFMYNLEKIRFEEIRHIFFILSGMFVNHFC
jgi:hypothetical protein